MYRAAILRAGMVAALVVGIGAMAGCEDRKASAPAGATTRPAAGTAQAGGASIVFKLPRPGIVGTPAKITETTAEPVSDKPRPPWIAPDGTVLLSLKKPVTASDREPVIGSLDMVTDGEKDATSANVVELAPGLQWVQIDLRKPATIHGLLVWHDHRDGHVYRDVVVQISDDADFINGVKTVFNNDQDNSAGLGMGKDKECYEFYTGHFILVDKVYDDKGVKGRYIRLYSKGNTGNEQNRYTEVEIYGVP